MEFRTLINRVLKKDGSPANPVRITTTHEAIQGDLFAELLPPVSSSQDAINYSGLQELKDIPHEYYLINKEEDIASLVGKLAGQTFCSFDTETTGLDPNTSELVGMSFAFKEGEAYYIPVPADRQEAQELSLNPI